MRGRGYLRPRRGYRTSSAQYIPVGFHTTGTNNTLNIQVATAVDALIYWGDGTTSSITGGGAATPFSHTYTDGIAGHDVGIGTQRVTQLVCNSCLVDSIELGTPSELELLYATGNQITSLDTAGAAALTGLQLFSNPGLTSLDITEATALQDLRVNNTGLTSLDVTQNTALTNLLCATCALTTLDVSQNTALNQLVCYNNQLASLNVNACTVLTNLECNNNLLTSLSVTGATSLNSLRFHNNQLTSVDVTQNVALTVLNCSGNPALGTIDITQNTSLGIFLGNSSGLTSLDPTNCVSLTRLEANFNSLAGLDVLQCTVLTNLQVRDNGMTQAQVDDILVDLETTVAGNPRGGTCQIHSSNSAPSVATGCPAYCSLTGTYGWTVVITGSCTCP